MGGNEGEAQDFLDGRRFVGELFPDPKDPVPQTIRTFPLFWIDALDDNNIEGVDKNRLRNLISIYRNHISAYQNQLLLWAYQNQLLPGSNSGSGSGGAGATEKKKVKADGKKKRRAGVKKRSN